MSLLSFLMLSLLTLTQPVVIMLEDVKRSFLWEQAAKTQARECATSLEERLKTLEEENASLKLVADEERSAKDRLLALVHSLAGMLPLPLLSRCHRFCCCFFLY